MSNQYNQYSEQPAYRRGLHRSATNKYVGGVLGGVAETYNIDATLVRVLFLLSFFLPGPQLLLYLVLWVVFAPAKYVRLHRVLAFTSTRRLYTVQVRIAA